MKINMKKWMNDIINSEKKKSMPILSFPAVQLLGISVEKLISSASLQAEGMELIAQRCDSYAAVSMMDLSVEAQAFGSAIKVSDNEVPTVTDRIITSYEDAENLKVPSIGKGRTGLYIDAIKKASSAITDRPVFAGVIGPFSLAGRLMDMTEIMINCCIEPEMVHLTLEKTTKFITDYIKAYKDAGANGVVMAEPAAGLLSPDLADEFSSTYIRKITEKLQDDDFAIIYHNCGNTIPLIDSMLSINAMAYHFGNSVKMIEVLKKMPSNIPVMGNIDPSSQFRNGTPASVREATLKLLFDTEKYSNFIISSGCDIPPLSSWENIDSFFAAVDDFYDRSTSSVADEDEKTG